MSSAATLTTKPASARSATPPGDSAAASAESLRGHQYNPPSSWAVHGTDGPIRATVDIAVEPLAGTDRTSLTISLDFEGHGIGKILPLLVRPQSRKELQHNMTRLKACLET
jgi:hypothetical protein